MSGQYSKCSNGYWQSSEEMFARAFACYVKDKLKNMGYVNDYLTGHSEDAVGIDAKTGETYLAVPEGEERIIFNRAFDEMFSELKRMQIL